MSNGMLRAILRGMLRIPPSDELTRVVLLRVMAVGSVQAVGYGMTKPQRWLVIDSAKFARWLVRHLWGKLLPLAAAISKR